jgi:hypothetical protein
VEIDPRDHRIDPRVPKTLWTDLPFFKINPYLMIFDF